MDSPKSAWVCHLPEGALVAITPFLFTRQPQHNLNPTQFPGIKQKEAIQVRCAYPNTGALARITGTGFST